MLAAVIAVVALTVGRSVFVPLSLAMIIGLALAPVTKGLRKFNIGRLAAVVLTTGIAFAVVAGIALFLSGQFGELAATVAPAHRTAAPLAASEPLPVLIARSLAGPMLNPLASAGLAVLFAAFLLLHQENLARRFASLAPVASAFGRQLLAQGLLDLGFGTAVALGLWAMSVPNFGLWALLGVMLRSVPFVGVPVAALCPLMLTGTPAPWAVAGTLLLFLGANAAVFLTERRWVRRTVPRLSALAAVGATILWTCVWGMTGLLLAIPLTLGAALIGRHFAPLKFLDKLLAGSVHASEPTPVVLPPADVRELTLAAHWQHAPVLCVAGPGVMDEAAAGLLAQALRFKGIESRVASFADVTASELPRLDTADIRAVCISCQDPGDAHEARRLIRRLRPRAPNACLIAGLWSWDGGALMDAGTLECDLVVTHVLEAAERIVRSARAAAEIETAQSAIEDDTAVRIACETDTPLADAEELQPATLAA
jgi:predicted PurR-regulated permease PerM